MGTVNAQMPRAAAGPQGASIRMPATTVLVRLGNSPAPLSPAHLLPTVPGATGLPGVPAVTRADLKGNRVAFGMGLGDKGLLHVHSDRIPGYSLLPSVPLLHPVSWPSLCWSPRPFLSHPPAYPGLSPLKPEDYIDHALSAPLLCSWPYPGPLHQAHGPRSVRRSSHRADLALRTPVHPCAYMKPASMPWGTAGCRESASNGKHSPGKGDPQSYWIARP